MRQLNAFGGWPGPGSGGEANGPRPSVAEYGDNNGQGRMALSTYDPSIPQGHPGGALGGGYNGLDQVSGASIVGGRYAMGIGSNTAQISAGSQGISLQNMGGNNYAGGGYDIYGHPRAIVEIYSGGMMPAGQCVAGSGSTMSSMTMSVAQPQGGVRTMAHRGPMTQPVPHSGVHGGIP